MIRTVIDCETNTTTEIEMTAEEIAEVEVMQADAQASMEAMQAELNARNALKVSAKAKLVAGQPLTEEEAATIVL